MTDERTPDSWEDLLAHDAEDRPVTAPLVPATPQFASRRELRDAAAASAKKAKAPAVRRTAKLSHKDKVLARKLAVAPTVAATSSSPRKPRR